MQFILVFLLAITIQSTMAEEKISGEETVESARPRAGDFSCQSLVNDVKREFGFDNPEKVASQRSRDAKIPGVKIEAMALDDGSGPTKLIIKAPDNVPNAKDILAPAGSSTLQTFTGYGLQNDSNIMVFKIEIFHKASGRKVDIVAKLDEKNQCKVNHIKIYSPNTDAKIAPQISEVDCQSNDIGTDSGGRLKVNNKGSVIKIACLAAWTHFGD